MSVPPRHILLLCHFEPGSAGTILEHVQAFPRFSANRYSVLNNLGDLPAWLDLSRFDGLIIHYSLIACYDNYLSPDARRRIREFPGFKAAFIQDDYRWINDTVNAFAYMRINALFALTGPEIMDAVYSPERLPGVRRETVLTGYVPEELTRRDVPALVDRPIDVGYRARKLPAWIGSHTLQKWQIADRFLADAPAYDLKVDISYREDARMYGDAWVRFVSNCKAVLGTESGASVCDFTGDIQRNVEAHVKRDPSASFETLRDLYFKDEDGKIMMNVISPRCFEAAALRTLMILYEGHYSGVLQPWRHYVPLKMDHSNMAEVVRILRDPVESQRIVDTAFSEVALSPNNTFRALIERVDRVIADESRLPPIVNGYSQPELDWRLRRGGFDMTKYAFVEASPRLSDGVTSDTLLQGGPDRPPVQSHPAEPAPHRLALRLRSPLRVSTLHLVFASPEAVATKGVVRSLRGQRVVTEVAFGASEPTTYLGIALEHSTHVDLIQVEFSAYWSGAAMSLRDVRLECAKLPLVERIMQWRQHLGLLFLYRIGHWWMRFPEPIRRAIRRPVRAAYDALFARK